MGGCCIMDNPVADFFRDLFSGGGCGDCGYHPGPSQTEAHAKKIANELAEMKASKKKISESTERKIIDDINSSMNDFIQELEKNMNKTYGGKSLNINIKGINEKNEALRKEVIGHIGRCLDDRLVQTDSELSVILQEKDDKKRAKNFDVFVERVQKQAISSLRTKIETTVKQQEEMVRREIQNRLNEVEKNMNEATEAYKKILETKERNESGLENEQIKYVYKHDLLEILSDQLEN